MKNVLKVSAQAQLYAQRVSAASINRCSPMRFPIRSRAEEAMPFPDGARGPWLALAE